MSISELQMGLVGAGGVVVVGIFAFNKWQERKHRKAMVLERWFGLDLSHKHYRLVA